ncbi:MAG: dihydrolipoyl dehydrogenase [Candidatus Omnitrophica bacterium]|nr:dihydrolipoyl dehydrogenase [Candidatus Omnitrophota bacterium]
MKTYDIAIIGSGPGGYVAGLYASRHGLNVAVIEKDFVGGTCLNRGCISTKSLLNSVSIFSKIKKAAALGVKAEGVSLDFARMMARKNEVVARLRAGIETLFRAAGVDLVRGQARLKGPGAISVAGIGDLKANNIIIAAGSRVAEIPSIRIDGSSVLSSDNVLDINAIPASILIVGGGVIGCEFANLFNKLGSKVTIVEITETLIPTQSREIAKKLELIMKKEGVDIYLASKVESIEKRTDISVKISGGRSVDVEKVLVSVGRRPNTESLGLEEVGIKTESGRICVDEYLRTSADGIYAIGDCVSGPLLAHKASYDGILACDNIMGKNRRVDYSNIPNCIWTDPEIASVGLSEEGAKASCADVKTAKFPYIASGKAYLEAETEGFVKIIGNSGGDILGVEIFGKDACNLIGEATLARTMGIKVNEWSRVVHAHPTLSEILQEASHAFCGKAIHGI